MALSGTIVVSINGCVDFDQFSRRMRLQYIFNGENNEPHPFHVKSGWIPLVQPSVALESYLEETKVLLAETQFTKPKNNLSYAEQKAVETLRKNTNINLKKADKGTRTVVLNTEDKIQEGQVQLDNTEHYRPLESPMVEEMSSRVKLLIRELHQHNHIDDMTNQWLCQTPNPPRIPVFYTLTKIHKPTPVGRPIISGCDGPTERLSSFVDRLLQPIAQKQKSYLKDSTDFINFIETTIVPERQCAKHTTLSIKTALPSLHNILKEHSNLSFKKTRLSLTEKTTSKYMEPPWEPRWQSLLPTSLCLR